MKVFNIKMLIIIAFSLVLGVYGACDFSGETQQDYLFDNISGYGITVIPNIDYSIDGRSVPADKGFNLHILDGGVRRTITAKGDSLGFSWMALDPYPTRSPVITSRIEADINGTRVTFRRKQ